MTVYIKQTIEKIEDGEYDIHMQVGDEDKYTAEYSRSNRVFPVYKELTSALLDFEDCDVEVTTNSEPLAKEFNLIENPNATLLNNLKELVSRQGITLTINYEEN